MFKTNKNLFVIAVIAVVNALGYGIVIPILYPYSQKFGLSDFQNGLLFASFAAAQFLATPFIGRMSDKFGRKPLLLISLLGTFASFGMMAAAKSAVWLFVARTLDGLTAGNISVAQAVISDSTDEKGRVRAFGIIGAAFGLGFVLGPVISGLSVGFGLGVPFVIAAMVTGVSVILTFVFLPETNKHKGQIRAGKLFDLVGLVKAVGDKAVGKTLLITLAFSTAFSLLIYAYQPMAAKVLHLNARQVSMNFTIIGLMGVVGQAVVVPFLIKRFKEKDLLVVSLIGQVVTFCGFALAGNWGALILVSIINSLVGSPVQPVISSFLTKEADVKSQGEILGISASYMSLGNIFGPLIGGIAASFTLRMPFFVGAFLMAVSALMAKTIVVHRHAVHLE